MSKRLRADHDNIEAQHRMELLHSMPRPVVEALLDGTFGHRYIAEPDFKDVIHPMDTSAGIYVSTFVVEGIGKGLCRTEYKLVKETMRLYIGS